MNKIQSNLEKYFKIYLKYIFSVVIFSISIGLFIYAKSNSKIVAKIIMYMVYTMIIPAMMFYSYIIIAFIKKIRGNKNE